MLEYHKTIFDDNYSFGKILIDKNIGIDQVIDGIVTRLGDLESAYLFNDYIESPIT